MEWIPVTASACQLQHQSFAQAHARIFRRVQDCIVYLASLKIEQQGGTFLARFRQIKASMEKWAEVEVKWSPLLHICRLMCWEFP